MATYTDRQDALRARGNVLYGEVAGGGGGDVAEKTAKLQRAQELYKEALELSYDSEKRASCCKNLGALHFLWGKVVLASMPSWPAEEGDGAGRRGGSVVGKLSPVKQEVGQAVSFYVRAYVEGARAKKSREWMEKVGSALTEIVAWAAEESKILAFSGAPILKSVCEDLERAGRRDLAFKAEAEALANLELAIYLSKQTTASSSMVLVNGIPAEVHEPLSHARHLLESLPATSPSADILRQRLSTFESDLLDDGDDIWRAAFTGLSLHKVTAHGVQP